MNDFSEIVKKYGLIAVIIILFLYYLFEKTRIIEETWHKYSFVGIVIFLIGLILIAIHIEKISFSQVKKEQEEMTMQKAFYDSFNLMLNNHVEFQTKIENFFENIIEGNIETQQSLNIIKEKLLELDKDFNLGLQKIYNKLDDSISIETYKEISLLYAEKIFMRIAEKFLETLSVMDACKNDKDCIVEVFESYKKDIRNILKEMGQYFYIKYSFPGNEEMKKKIKKIFDNFADTFGKEFDINLSLGSSSWKENLLRNFLCYAKDKMRKEVNQKIDG